MQPPRCIDDAQMILFCDGHSHQTDKGTLVASYAMVQQQPGGHRVVEAAILPHPASAQLAELTALTKACHLARDTVANIYTDSAYAHQSVHVDISHA